MTFDGCPHRDIPQAVKVPMNQAGIIPSSAFLAVPRMRHVSIEAGILQLEPKLGNAVAISGWSKCPVLLCLLKRTPFEGATCSIASQYQAAWSLATKRFFAVDPRQWRRGQPLWKCNQIWTLCLFVDCINLATFVLQEDGRNPELHNQEETIGNCRQDVCAPPGRR